MVDCPMRVLPRFSKFFSGKRYAAGYGVTCWTVFVLTARWCFESDLQQTGDCVAVCAVFAQTIGVRKQRN